MGGEMQAYFTVNYAAVRPVHGGAKKFHRVS